MAGELVLMALGACRAFFLRTRSDMWTATGMGLLLQASVLLVLDVAAERRAHAYSQWLSTW